MTTYADATTTQTQQQIRDAWIASLNGFNSAVGGLTTASPDRGLIEAEASMMALEQTRRANVALAATILGAAQAGLDSWVDALAGWYQPSNGAGGIGRIQATQAVWTVGLAVTTAAAPLTLHVGDTVQIQAADSAHSILNLTITANVTLSAGSSYKGTATFTARLAGTATAGTATTIQNGSVITGPAGLSVDATVTPTLVTAARDQETSLALANRCLAKWGTIGAGWTLTAMNYWIPTFSPTVTRWLINDANPLGPGTVQVWLADAAGPATGGEVAAVQAGLSAANFRPIGSGQLTATAAPAYADTITVTVKGDGSNSNLAANITSALNALNNLGAGSNAGLGPLYITAGFLTQICLGTPFGPTVAMQTSAGVYAEVPFTTPGFGGAATVVSLTTSQGLASGVGPANGPGSADFVPLGNVLVVTPAVTVT